MRWLDAWRAATASPSSTTPPPVPEPVSDTEPQIIVVERPGCVDMEDYARIHNEGFAAAVAQGLHDDPIAAEEWLTAHVAALVDVQPFRLLLTDVEGLARHTGGGQSAAYADAAARLRRALEPYTPRH